MSGRVQAQVKAPSGPAPSFAPVQSGLLQRKSLLGGAPGLAGEFADYRGKRLVSQPPLIQTKLTINQPNDRYEQEADRVADAVMRTAEPRVQRQPVEEGEEEELVQAKPIAEQITPLIQRPAEGEEEEEVVQPRSEKSGTSSGPIRYVQRAVAWIQAKLRIGQPGDKYEQEADRVADAVMRMPELGVQRQPIEDEEEEQIQTKPVSEQITPLVQRQVEEEEEEEEELQTKTTSGNIPEVQPNIESQIHSLKGGGQPLSENDRAFFEPRFGADFSQVRVHTDTRAAETAKSLKTRAFTVGRDIAFGVGQYAPESHEGRQLLAHELTHVVQQNDGVSAYIQRNNPRSVSNMTMEEKWSIVYGAAIYGAGDGMVMALTILLGFILLIALAAVILAILCPPCIATISAFLATTIWGASVAVWLTALLASLGAAVAIGTIRSEYVIVNRAVGQAQTEDDLRHAGQRWGHNTGRELVNLIASIFAASSRVRTFVGNLARRLPGQRLATPPTRAGSRRELLDLFEARIGQINAARGDLTLFRNNVRLLRSRANTVRPLTDVAADVNELLTRFRNVRTVTGGGRSGRSVSTYIESLDGRFSVRITHSQVGATPVGQPALPRIHIYEGAVGRHGRTVVLPSGTTLNDIMGELGL